MRRRRRVSSAPHARMRTQGRIGVRKCVRRGLGAPWSWMPDLKLPSVCTKMEPDRLPRDGSWAGSRVRVENAFNACMFLAHPPATHPTGELRLSMQYSPANTRWSSESQADGTKRRAAKTVRRSMCLMAATKRAASHPLRRTPPRRSASHARCDDVLVMLSRTSHILMRVGLGGRSWGMASLAAHARSACLEKIEHLRREILDSCAADH